MATKPTAAVRELRAVYNELNSLTAGNRQLNKGEETRHAYLLSRAKVLRENPAVAAGDDFAKRWFHAFFNGYDLPIEGRTSVDGQAGQQTVSWTQGVQGGYLVPIEFVDALFLGMALVDPLVNPDVVTIIERKTNRPLVIPSWDLSTFKAVKKAEAATQTRKDFPTAKNDKIGGGDKYTYVAQVAASFELEDDDFQPVVDQLGAALGIGLARGIGQDLAVGDGATAPKGIVNAADSGVTQASVGVVIDTDLDNVFYSVDPFYRAQPKCAWLVTDAVHKQIRKAKDTGGRPLINIVNGAEFLMGKPLYISPSLPAYNASVNPQLPGSFCVFGDLSRYVVTLRNPNLTRNTQSSVVGADSGEALYVATCNADATVVDPTSGTKPAIVTARLHS